ncbi:hypothetical protein ScPMuIL_017491 [Solemya velum]
MNSSGLKEVLELVYADNAVTHMLSGKVYARAVRAHTLMNAAMKSYSLPPPEKMNEKGIRTVSAEGDADVLIAETGVKCSAEGLTYVIVEDTDVLVLLCHYSKDDSKGLLFRSDRKTSKRRVWDISLVRQTLGTELCRMLPVIHSIGGCDTTSRLFGIGKGSALKKTQTVMAFKEQIGILCESELNTVEVQNAGEKDGPQNKIKRKKFFCNLCFELIATSIGFELIATSISFELIATSIPGTPCGESSRLSLLVPAAAQNIAADVLDEEPLPNSSNIDFTVAIPFEEPHENHESSLLDDEPESSDVFYELRRRNTNIYYRGQWNPERKGTSGFSGGRTRRAPPLFQHTNVFFRGNAVYAARAISYPDGRQVQIWSTPP